LTHWWNVARSSISTARCQGLISLPRIGCAGKVLSGQFYNPTRQSFPRPSSPVPFPPPFPLPFPQFPSHLPLEGVGGEVGGTGDAGGVGATTVGLGGIWFSLNFVSDRQFFPPTLNRAERARGLAKKGNAFAAALRDLKPAEICFAFVILPLTST
jgi:hypothetical protein